MIHEQRPEDSRRTETLGDRNRDVRDQPRGDVRGYREPEGRYDYEMEEYGRTELREPRTQRDPYSYRETYRGEPVTEAPAPVQTVYSTSGINILAGLWLILAPFALDYATVEAALWNSVIVGIAVAVMAIVRVTQPREYEGVSWVNFVLGIWLVVSPFVLNLMNIEALVWNNIIVGVIVLALAATSAMATRRLHEPHRGRTPRRRWT